MAAHPFWYHTIDVGGGVVTPGWFDLRPAVDTLPWPDVRGKRCLDIGTFDGFMAFELERRGAAEVLAIDIEDHRLWDWPPDARPDRPGAPAPLAAFAGPPKGEGFRIAARLRGSGVKWRALSAYDLDPMDIGRFDVVVCGSLLLHLRDPLRALEAVRSVCTGHFLSSEQIDLWLSVLHRGQPLARLNGSGPWCEWWVPNANGHWRMLYAAGFEIVEVSRPYVEVFNQHPKPVRSPRRLIDAAAVRVVSGTWRTGVLHRALLARPRV